MKKMLQEYIAFNTWANEKICQQINLLSDEQLSIEIVSSFKSIRETLLHIWFAQDIWLERLHGNSPVKWPSRAFEGTKEELIAGLITSSRKLEEKAFTYSKQKLKQQVSYKTLKGLEGQSSVYQVLMHVANHGTYHRGQLVTMLRQAGSTSIPATDLIAFYREAGK